MAPPDDATIIERSVRDPEAFAILYDRHAATLHRYAARRLGESAADDIVADTFLAACGSGSRTGSSSPTTPPPSCRPAPA